MNFAARLQQLPSASHLASLQLLGADASLVSLNQVDARAGSKAAEDSADEPAVLITGKPKRRGDIEILVRSGMFTSLNEVEMLSGNKRYRLKPTRVVERNARSERVAFQLSE